MKNTVVKADKPITATIGLVASNSVTQGGGEARFLAHLIDGFGKLQVRSTLFNPGVPTEGFRGARVVNVNTLAGGLRTRFESIRRPLRVAASRTKPVYPWLTTTYLSKSRKWMAGALTTGPPCDDYLAIGSTAPDACRSAGVDYTVLCVSMIHETYKHVFREEGAPSWSSRRAVRKIAEMERSGLRGSTFAMANGLDLVAYLKDFAGLEDVALLRSPVWFASKETSRQAARRELRLPAEVTIIATVGRLDATKGVDTLLKACQRIEDAHPGTELLLAGDGPKRRSLERLARDLRVPARFLGYSDDLHSLYRAADMIVLLFPTLGGVSMAMLEAMSCGTAVITNRIAGRDTIPDEGQVILVNERSAESVRLAIDKLIADPTLRAHVGQRGRRYIEENHNWSQFSDSLRHIMERPK